MTIDRRKFMASTAALVTPWAVGACSSLTQGSGSGRPSAKEGRDGSVATRAVAGKPKTRPNVIFIVADDLGFADLGCYGGRDAEFGPVSPVIDRLAAQGMLFTQGYSNSPVCSPTRFALATGRYQYRYRGAMEEPILTRNADRFGLPPDEPTIASLLRDAGYRTALIGKWHLGLPPAFGPTLSGYEMFFGNLGGAVDYITHQGEGAIMTSG